MMIVEVSSVHIQQWRDNKAIRLTLAYQYRYSPIRRTGGCWLFAACATWHGPLSSRSEEEKKTVLCTCPTYQPTHVSALDMSVPLIANFTCRIPTRGYVYSEPGSCATPCRMINPEELEGCENVRVLNVEDSTTIKIVASS